MRKPPALGYVIFLFVALIASHLFAREISAARVTQSFAPTVCPAPGNDGVTTALVPNKRVQVHDVVGGKQNVKFKNAGNISRQVGKVPLLIAGNPGTTFALQTKTGVWTGGTICTTGISDSWFVGGSADITGQSVLSLVNSGLSDAIIKVIVYSEKGRGSELSYTVKQSSQKDIRLDSITPGSTAVALHLTTQTGRVTSYLFDERKKGLRNFGGDYVNAQDEATQEVFIGGVPTFAGKGVKVTHRIRLMNASDVATAASIQIANRSGVITPVGLDAVDLKPGIVREIPLDGELGNDPLSIKIVADQKIVASVYTYIESKSKRDFLWSTPSESNNELDRGPIALNLNGLEPTLTLASDKIDVTVKWTNFNGKMSSTSLRSLDVINWKVPANTRTVSIERNRKAAPLSGGGFIWSSTSGFGFLPLKSGAVLEVSTRPISNAGTIS